MTPDKRIRLVDGYNLEIRDIQTKDAGNYVCHIATMEPREITHTVEILGKFSYPLHSTPHALIRPAWFLIGLLVPETC